MTDDLLPLDPAPDPTPVPNPRVLTDAENTYYTDRLGAVGYTYAVSGADEPIGFDVTGEDAVYNYRYDGSATTAVELMDRICAERGA